jgi:RNA polymerase sigma-70 factor (sigma-E family)
VDRVVGGGGRERRVEFEEFLDREWDGLARYARVLCSDRHQAEDLLAESLLKAHRSWRRISSPDAALAYVRRIVTTTVISQRRSWSARHIRLTRSGALPDIAAADTSRLVEMREELSSLLGVLPTRQRVAVACRYLLGLSDAETADQMGCSVGTVRGYISRALVTMRIAAGRTEG